MSYTILFPFEAGQGQLFCLESKLPEAKQFSAELLESDPTFGKGENSARAGTAQESLVSSVNKVWLRKLNEIIGVILKEQIALKGFRWLQISLQMDGANYQQGVAPTVRQVSGGPVLGTLEAGALSSFCLQFTFPAPIIRGTW